MSFLLSVVEMADGILTALPPERVAIGGR